MARKRRLRAKNRFGVVVPIDLAAEDVTMNNGNTLEQEIASLEQEKADIEEKMSAGQGSSEDFAAWGRRYAEISPLIEEKTMRWLELSEKDA